MLAALTSPNGGQIAFNGNSSAGSATIVQGGGPQMAFNESSSAGNATISNYPGFPGSVSQTIFNGTSRAGSATITNYGGGGSGTVGGQTVFNDTSTAGSATVIANSGNNVGGGDGAIFFNGGSTGGTARVEVIDSGYLDISNDQSSLTIGSIEGTGYVFLGSNTLIVGSNNLSTTFSGTIQGSGGLGKIGSGVLTFGGRQTSDYIADTVGLILVSGSIINLNFTGPPDLIATLMVDGVAQPPGVYGSPNSGAPHPLPEFAGRGTVQVGATATPTPTPTPTHPAFFTGETALGGGWYYLQFANGPPFGYYSYLPNQNFIYHIDLGFEYLFDANDVNHAIYFYDFASSSFFYTSPILFPDLYDFSLNAWLYYLPDVNNPGRYSHNPRWFYNFATGQWITL